MEWLPAVLRLFLNPLILYAYKGIDFHPWLRGNIDGIPVKECQALMSSRELPLRSGVAKHVTLHAAALKMVKAPSTSISSEVASSSPETSPLILGNIASLKKTLDRLKMTRSSFWTGYSDENTYSRDSTEKKERFVRRVLEDEPSKLVIDFGCNTGFYSRAAADFSEYVVAIDTDHASVDQLYRNLQGQETILPLVFDIVNPSPALGWRRKERAALEERMKLDVILALALIHHLVIGRNVPLPEGHRLFRGLPMQSGHGVGVAR